MLSADFANLQDAVEMVNQSDADWIHLDIMDGRFVPNISFGLPVVKAIHKHAQKPLDIHLMIVEPEKYLAAFHEAGADVLTVHYEACDHLHRTVQEIKQMGIRAGVAINPHTPVSLLADIIGEIDVVCMMSVNPGFGGQRFIRQTLNKTIALKKMILDTGSEARIEIDGGVTLDNAEEILKSGADALVAGNTVFGADDPSSAIAHLKNIETNTFQV